MEVLSKAFSYTLRHDKHYTSVIQYLVTFAFPKMRLIDQDVGTNVYKAKSDCLPDTPITRYNFKRLQHTIFVIYYSLVLVNL